MQTYLQTANFPNKIDATKKFIDQFFTNDINKVIQKICMFFNHTSSSSKEKK